jgi:undecaprenyl phosphate N,N'-diacetylbacillosamine 1-phosphate transferase
MEDKRRMKSSVRQQSRSNVYARYLKRPFGFMISLVALIVLSPVFLIIALLVGIKLGSPVIFKQQRIGRHEQVFTLYKFRTLSNDRDGDGNLLPDRLRATFWEHA